jgi:hypothetical protein
VVRPQVALDQEAVVVRIETAVSGSSPANPRTLSIESQRVNITNSVRSSRSRRSIQTPRLPAVAA